jgi:hypothetical protein
MSRAVFGCPGKEMGRGSGSEGFSDLCYGVGGELEGRASGRDGFVSRERVSRLSVSEYS